jgi:hypothetical protein
VADFPLRGEAGRPSLDGAYRARKARSSYTVLVTESGCEILTALGDGPLSTP